MALRAVRRHGRHGRETSRHDRRQQGPRRHACQDVVDGHGEVWAQGIGETKGEMGYEPEKVTAEFVMRAVARFLERCGSDFIGRPIG